MDIISVIENLMPNILTVVTQLCATALMFFILKKFAWKPVKKILAERSAYEQKKLEEAEALRKENEELKRQIEEELAKADEKAQRTLDKAVEEGNRMKESLVNEGKERSEQMLAEAQQNIELQKNRMLDEVQREIVDAAISATEKMLNEKLDEKSDRQVIDNFIKEVTKK